MSAPKDFTDRWMAGRTPDGRAVELVHCCVQGQERFEVRVRDLADTVEMTSSRTLDAAMNLYFCECEGRPLKKRAIPNPALRTPHSMKGG